MDISIIIPIKVDDPRRVEGLEACLKKLARDSEMLEASYEVIIVDTSTPTAYEQIDSWFRGTPIVHFCPSDRWRTGANDKLNSIEAALDIANGKTVLLIDDDCRPTADILKSMIPYLNIYDSLRFMVSYKSPTILDMLNACGIFLVNIVCEHKQFWGNIAFRRQMLQEAGFPSKDVLFDELAFDLVFRRTDRRIGYVTSIAIPMVQNSGKKEFLSQRVRYAYENLAYPGRFMLFLLILPIITGAGLFAQSWTLISLIIVAITLAVVTTTLIGQLGYSCDRYPKATFLLSPIWFWFYPFTTWVALFKYISGNGISFGGRIIRKPV